MVLDVLALVTERFDWFEELETRSESSEEKQEAGGGLSLLLTTKVSLKSPKKKKMPQIKTIYIY